MGLSSHLDDVSSDSLPLLLLAALAAFLSYLRSLLCRLLLLHHHRHRFAADVDADASCLAAQLGSGLAGLSVLADHLASNPSFSFSSTEQAAVEEDRVGSERGHHPGCAVCLCGFGDGERMRRLSCRHAFHSECIERWFLHQMNLSCPLCRSPLAAPESRAAADCRIGAELVAWLAPH